MDSALKDKWVAVLRSGEYKQGRSRLNYGNKYCCLGVLCEVAGLPKEKSKLSEISTYFDKDGTSGGGAYGISSLPRQFAEEVGIGPFGDLKDAVLIKNGASGSALVTALASLNDNGVTFADIADVIEEQF